MTAIINGKIVTPEDIMEDKVLLLGGDRILGVTDGIPDADRIIDANGGYILPGFIDIHSDRIEQCILPRPTSMLDFELALKECESELLHLGITTMYHSLTLYKDEFFGKSPIRTKENVKKLAGLIGNIHNRSHLIRHRFHLRIEIDNFEAYDIARAMIESGQVHEISFMDHTPGQGQYRNLEIYQKTISSYQGREVANRSFEEILEYHRGKETLSLEQLRELAELAHAHGIAVASHDDDTVEKLELNERLGVDICEFPITIETAKAAHEKGLFTVVGAPNILLGGSHSGNMSAAEAIQEGCADIICSDYYPPAILHGIFIMAERYGISLSDMVNKATLHPARAMKIDGDYGAVERGKKADLLVVEVLDGYPVITHVLVDGRVTAQVAYRR
ncbi:alpha-D-ribose 1-methylphosphonate 5-triphosphate diphosphatase [Sporobacter termitidis DSM 10068]|uniref:Alpha-D-ribose 1-methylphosphonate 5-triphosphate diphosphatase n=1 Tax=Sporobacter termitidis DSM 10068 TaxID=1123282 RepID=A0A1M5Z7M2_9FIRM|nr:alpha-D-ribose 1-methylphosphonate 5-triphosphate diphosphatase [Sporobacter termitidis]SHI20239.1 alpha-D-ribose 1-methylphosphonate 5-triphosphate diphosphatase [Sporobacter termitidis DSM 10068]